MAEQASLMELWMSFLSFAAVAVTLEPLLCMIISPDYSPRSFSNLFFFFLIWRQLYAEEQSGGRHLS